ncbi:MAG TPA: alpha-L-fucosidase [Acidimicrobiales bacterium]|nr:alpha-L-fucosidase [Acidimicrobiales bacterium]
MTDLAARRGRVPTWWADGKLGIFVHWGLFSVPGFAPVGEDLADLQTSRDPAPFARSPYAEWYQNSLRFPESPVSVFHHETYGEGTYEDFVEPFVDGLESWEPERWAELFASTGATHVVFVAKHCDGFCLWPTSVLNPNRTGWHTERDVVGEMAAAVRARGLRFGLYYSGGLDWTFDASPIGSFGDMLASTPGGGYADYADAQVRELIERYEPSVLWNDVSWPAGQSHLVDLLGTYFDRVPDGVVNDRWLTPVMGSGVLKTRAGRKVVDRLAANALKQGPLVPPKPRFFQYRTPEFAKFPDISRTPWECVRGMDRSFGFNRASVESDFLDRNELLRLVVDVASKGGSVLLNIGPRGDGAIPDEQLRRLGWLAERSTAHRASIRGTRAWVHAQDRSVEGHDVRFSAHDETVWAHFWRLDAHALRASTITLPFRANPATTVTDTAGGDLAFTVNDDSLTIDIPTSVDESVCTIGIHHAVAANDDGVTGASSRPTRRRDRDCHSGSGS